MLLSKNTKESIVDFGKVYSPFSIIASFFMLRENLWIAGISLLISGISLIVFSLIFLARNSDKKENDFTFANFLQMFSTLSNCYKK